MLEIFIQSFVLYFVVIDPLGNTPIFMTVTQQQNVKEKNKTAIESVLIATIILVLFSVIGNFLLSYLNISLAAFRIAGGMILFIIALEMLFNKRQQRKEKNIENISDNVATLFTLHPLFVPGSAIKPCLSSFQCFFPGNLIHIGEHQDLPGFGVLNNGGNETAHFFKVQFH